MADHTDVLRGIHRAPHVRYPVLTPNIQGFQDAVSSHLQFTTFMCVTQSNSSVNSPDHSRTYLSVTATRCSKVFYKFSLLLQVAAGATEVAVFGSASETFSKNNINCTIDESMLRFEEVINSAKKQQIPVRGLVFSNVL